MRCKALLLSLLTVALATSARPAQAQLAISVKHGPTAVPVGSTFEFGNGLVGENLARTFTVTNISAASVNVSYGLGGDAANPILFDYGVITGTTLAPGASGSFELIFSSPTARTVTNQVRLFVNGAPHYEFWARATATNPLGPILRVTHNGQLVSAGSTVDYGATGLHQPLSRSFLAHNDGDQPLTVSWVGIGSHVNDPAHFTAVSNQATNLPPGGSAPIVLAFDAAGLGTVTSEIDLFVGGVSRLRFHVRATTAAADFQLGVTPSSRTVSAGDGTSYSVGITGLYGFSANVALSVSGLPAGTSASFQPSTLAPGGNSTLHLNTSPGTPGGTRTLTLTGSGGGITRTRTVTLTVHELPPATFSLAASPASRTVTPGSSATFTVAITPEGGFSEPVALSATGLPPAASLQFTPPTVNPGTTAQLTVATGFSTPPGSYPLTLTGSGGGQNASDQVQLVVSEGPPPTGEPVIDALTPEQIPDGAITRLTLQGSHFHGVAVAIATEPATPGSPTPTVFPAVNIASISADGRTLEVDVDARASGVRGFYTLVVTNSLGGAAAPFRVLPSGPVVDAWTPSEPARGRLYSLLLLGENLAGATVSVTGGGGVNVHGLTSSAGEINGFLEITDNAPLGPRDLVVRVGSRQTSVPIQVVASSLRQENNVTAVAAQQAAKRGRLVPEIYLQEVTLGPGLAFAREPQGENRGVLCSITLGWRIYRYAYTVALPFDPLSGRILFDLLRNLQLGIPIPAGVEIFSAFADLVLQVRFNCFPFSHLEVCLFGNIGFEIPGIGGQIFSAGGCFLGGTFFPVLTTTGSLSSFEFSTPGQCSSVQATTLPGAGGIQEAEVTLNSCCVEPLQIDVAGRSFPGTFYQWSFEAFDFPVAEISPAPSACPACSCSVTAPGFSLEPGQSATVNFTLTNLTASACTFNWSATNTGDGAAVTLSSPGGSAGIPAGQTRTLPLVLTLPGGTTTAATPQVRFSALSPNGDSQECAAVAQGCVLPFDETTRFLLRPPESDLAEFGGQLIPILDWSNQQVTEDPAGSGTAPVDTCYFEGSPYPRIDGSWISGGTWTADSVGAWQTDTIGVFGELDEVIGGLGGPLPCRWEITQHMKRVCPAGPVEYTTNRFLVDVRQDGTVICRDGVCTPTRE